MSGEVTLLFLNERFAVVRKPAGIPSESDPSGDPDALTLTSRLLEAKGERPDLWLIHRLDRTVGGVLAFARSAEAAKDASAAITDRKSEKEYFAVAEGVAKGGVYRDLLYKDAKQSKAFVVDRARRGVKEAELIAETLAVTERNGQSFSLVKIRLVTGRFHQIRVQFASRGTPLVGDKKYGARTAGASMPALCACRFSLPSEFSVTDLPECDVYPWNLFDKEYYTCDLT